VVEADGASEAGCFKGSSGHQTIGSEGPSAIEGALRCLPLLTDAGAEQCAGFVSKHGARRPRSSGRRLQCLLRTRSVFDLRPIAPLFQGRSASDSRSCRATRRLAEIRCNPPHNNGRDLAVQQGSLVCSASRSCAHQVLPARRRSSVHYRTIKILRCSRPSISESIVAFTQQPWIIPTRPKW